MMDRRKYVAVCSSHLVSSQTPRGRGESCYSLNYRSSTEFRWRLTTSKHSIRREFVECMRLLTYSYCIPLREHGRKERGRGFGHVSEGGPGGLSMSIGSIGHGCQMAIARFFTLAQSKERKGSNFAAQCSGAIVQKPEGPNTHNPKIWLKPSGNNAHQYFR